MMYYIGYLFILVLAIIIGIIAANWIPFLIGAGIQLIALLVMTIGGTVNPMAWLFYLIFSLIGVLFIVIRINRKKK